MTRFPFRGSTSVTLVLAVAIAQNAVAQKTPPPAATYRPYASDSAERSYKIYSLDDFAGDPDFCKWIAQTISSVIAPNTWSGDATISYYAPKNILVVYHTPAVQSQVDGFLKDIKKSLSAKTKAQAAAPTVSYTAPAVSYSVVPAAHRNPEPHKAARPAPPESNVSAPEPSPRYLQHPPQYIPPSPPSLRPGKAAKSPKQSSMSYPVAAPKKTPKHLFHFIIRYEGEGIVDDNIVKAMKDYYKSQTTPQTVRYGYISSAPPASLSIATPGVKEDEDKNDDKSKKKEDKKDGKSTDKDDQP